MSEFIKIPVEITVDGLRYIAIDQPMNEMLQGACVGCALYNTGGCLINSYKCGGWKIFKLKSQFMREERINKIKFINDTEI